MADLSAGFWDRPLTLCKRIFLGPMAPRNFGNPVTWSWRNEAQLGLQEIWQKRRRAPSWHYDWSTAFNTLNLAKVPFLTEHQLQNVVYLKTLSVHAFNREWSEGSKEDEWPQVYYGPYHPGFVEIGMETTEKVCSRFTVSKALALNLRDLIE